MSSLGFIRAAGPVDWQRKPPRAEPRGAAEPRDVEICDPACATAPAVATAPACTLPCVLLATSCFLLIAALGATIVVAVQLA